MRARVSVRVSESDTNRLMEIEKEFTTISRTQALRTHLKAEKHFLSRNELLKRIRVLFRSPKLPSVGRPVVTRVIQKKKIGVIIPL